MSSPACSRRARSLPRSTRSRPCLLDDRAVEADPGLIAPLLTYTTTVAVDGNGFVAAFVCGIAFRYVRQAPVRRHGAQAPAASDFQLIEDTNSMMTMVMWFFFGNAVVLALSEGIHWPVLLLCAAALTILRILPVALAFLGSLLGGGGWPRASHGPVRWRGVRRPPDGVRPDT
ncbi:cation:proton antiporter [Streptomyces sp. C]|uniref:cation:proton antiporter domain-containing protein n=1 Tax=Streptomyces sp. C TaxID=253839 RepID=UPI0001DEEE44|nr:cation:proton antiporter [Streptomyces sp. C]EFL13325.1 predicted protein [Streptomyces sp. C]